MYGSKRVTVRDLNPHIMCVLCGGYLIQATTVIECLHSFCRSCLVNFLETSKVCPICDVQVHKTRPLLNIRADQTLQSLVYKLVPGLFQDEMRKRREFHATTPESYVKELNLEERGEATMEREVTMGCETISLVLQLVGRLKKDDAFQVTDQRYLLCPSEVTVGLLKRFILMKFNLGKEHKIAMYRAKEELTDDLMLQDVALIYFWKGDRPMHLCYTITYDHKTKRGSQKKSITMPCDTKLSSTELNNNKKTVASTPSKLESKNSTSETNCCREVSMSKTPTTLSPHSVTTISPSTPLTSSSSSSSLVLSLVSSSSSSLSSSSSSSSSLPSSSLLSSTSSVIYSSPSQSSIKCSAVLSTSVSSSKTSFLSSSASNSSRCSASTTFSTIASSSSLPAFHTEKSTTMNNKEAHVPKHLTSIPSIHTGMNGPTSSHKSSFVSRSPATTLSSSRSSSSSSIYSSSLTAMSTSPSLPSSVVAKVNTTSPLKGKVTTTASISALREGVACVSSHLKSKMDCAPQNVSNVSGRVLKATDKGETKCENSEDPNDRVCHKNGALSVASHSARPENVISSSQAGFESKKTTTCSSRLPNAARSQTAVCSLNQNNSRGASCRQDQSNDNTKLPVPKQQDSFTGQNVPTCTRGPTPLIIHSVQSILDHRPRKSQDQTNIFGGTGSNILKSSYDLEPSSKNKVQSTMKSTPSFKDTMTNSQSKKRKSSSPGKWPLKDTSSLPGQVDPLLASKSNTIRTDPVMQSASNIPFQHLHSALPNKPWAQRSISTDESQGSFAQTQEKRNWKKRKLSEIDQESSASSSTVSNEFRQNNNGASTHAAFTLAKSVECQSQAENESRILPSSRSETNKRRCSPSSASTTSTPASLLAPPPSSLSSSMVTVATWSRLGMAGMYPIAPMLDKRAGSLLYSSSNVGAMTSFAQGPWPSNALPHAFLSSSPGRPMGKSQKLEASPCGEANFRGEEHKKMRSASSNVKEISNKGRQEKVDDICVDISNVSGDSCSDVTSPGTSLTSPGLSVTSPGTDATSPGTEDRPDSSVLPDCQPPCEASYSMTILTKPTPLDLTSGHKKN